MSDTTTEKTACSERAKAKLSKRKYSNLTSIMRLFAYIIIMANTQTWVFIAFMLLMLAEIRNLTKY
jgi:hypothetical protein